jgi:hypothetical protein
MFFAEAQIRVHLYGKPADMRKSYDGLQALARHAMDKFAWHLPLYRHHQRLAASGITVSRPWLTQLAQRSISLLEPIYQAQFASIRASRVKTMDETPIKAGRSGHGKMQTGYFWPVYGEEDEVCFPFHPSRSSDFVAGALGLKAAVGSVLLTDGYAAYQRYAEKIGITHAQCWSHSRRGFFEALDAEPEGAASALEQIKAMYALEEQIRCSIRSFGVDRILRAIRSFGAAPTAALRQSDAGGMGDAEVQTLCRSQGACESVSDQDCWRSCTSLCTLASWCDRYVHLMGAG